MAGKTSADYAALRVKIEAVEAATGAYLTDENIDAENVRDAGIPETSPDYWDAMYRSMTDAAGSRAEETKLDINALLGFVIY